MRRDTVSFWTQNRRGIIILLVSLVVIACLSCMLLYTFVISDKDSTSTEATEEPSAGPAGELSLAYSPEKADLMRHLIEEFNAARFKTPDGERASVRGEALDPETMITASLAGNFQAISPDSSIWLDELDRAWAEGSGSQSPLVGQSFRYAVSPVVIAMWEDVARSLGYPEQPIGWQTIQDRARADSSFRWSHPSTNSASGLLATLAQFYAGAGKTRNLTPADAQAEATLQYVSAIEKTVRFYGEGEIAVIERALREGRAFLDAFVVQEQMVISFNTRRPAGQERLIAIYPEEGTLWEDHPMALLEVPSLSPTRRQVFSRWREYLGSPETQQKILEMGYRPSDLDLPLEGPGSPFTAANGVDPRQPQTTLQIPSSSVVSVVRDVWWYTKRHTNVYLVVDVSGSMRGQKLSAAQDALRIFMGQIAGDQEAIGLIEFSTDVHETVPLARLDQNRVSIASAIENLYATGETSLLDAVDLAYYRLQQLQDAERINAIVVMTDGRENDSTIRLPTLERRMAEGNQDGVPVVIFCIAYGSDADYDTLGRIAEATGGQVREGDTETIQALYKILSSYF